MHALRVGDVSDDFRRVHVDDNHMRGVGDVQAPGAAIGGQVVPAAVSADRDFLHDVITGRGGAKNGRPQKRQPDDSSHDPSPPFRTLLPKGPAVNRAYGARPSGRRRTYERLPAAALERAGAVVWSCGSSRSSRKNAARSLRPL